MPAIFIFTFFIFGIFVGSFLNVIADRLNENRSFVFGRSSCDFCNATLKARDLIPLFSFVFQKGRCRHCNEKLSLFYPFAEFITGISFVLAAILSGVLQFIKHANSPLNMTLSLNELNSWLFFVFFIVVFCFYIVIFLSDAKYQIIPNKVVIPAIIFVFGFLVLSKAVYFFQYYDYLKNNDFGVYLIRSGYFSLQVKYALQDLLMTVGSALSIGLFFWFLIFITKGRGMGYGDIKLGVLVGLVNGYFLNFLAIFMGFAFGAVVSLFLIALGKKTMKDAIAFGPFLVVASVFVLFYGGVLLQGFFGV